MNADKSPDVSFSALPTSNRNEYLARVDGIMAVIQLGHLEDLKELGILQKERAEIARENRAYLAPAGRVSEAMAELELAIASEARPEAEGAKKETVAERELRLALRLRESPHYQEIQDRQLTGQAQLDELDVAINMIERRLVFYRLQMEYASASLRFLGA